MIKSNRYRLFEKAKTGNITVKKTGEEKSKQLEVLSEAVLTGLSHIAATYTAST
jgi:hypothetical protein